MSGDFWVWRVGGGKGVIAGFCGRLRGFFDALFGDGAGARLVGEGDNLRVAAGVYRDFLDFGARQGAAARAMLEEAVWRYDPARALRGDADA